MDQVSSTDGQINHVSDTALMVAACRALETELPDAFARDPFAARLAGERGFAILNAVPYSMVLRFGMAVRTRFLDELLTGVLANDGISTVLSVGCGLDTRPWRLEIPADLHWIEVDFPDVLDYKYKLLADERAHCEVERLSVDLNDRDQRQSMYDEVRDRALMITEGVLM
jgi:methyltransferase (TIGR00027 family)